MVFALVMLIPFGVAYYYDYYADPILYPQPHSSIYFLETIFITLGIAGILYGLGRKAKGSVYRREGLASVVLIWVLLPGVATLPFLLSGALEDPLKAYFETVSGLTTTGSSILEAKKFDPETGEEIPIERIVPGVVTTVYNYHGTIEPVWDENGKEIRTGLDALSRGLLFWRSFLQYLGGGGVVVLFVALLPMMGGDGKLLFTTEVSGPLKDSLTPRISDTAIQLWKIYTGLIVLEIILLLIFDEGMTVFDAFTTSFSTVSTGGFTVRNTSIGYYENPATEWIVMVFMILGSINFALYYSVLRGKLFRLYDRELFIFLGLVFLCCSLGSWFLIGMPKILLNGETNGVFSVSEAIRYASFQVVSMHTTTGFATADFDLWPFATQAIMLLAMYFGGMSGSTAAGIKSVRLYILFRIAQFKVESLFRPETVRTFRIGDKEVNDDVSLMVLCFFLILASSSALCALLFIMNGLDLETAFGVASSLINNSGMAFRAGSPTASLAFLSDFGLLLGSFMMILGRLEFFVVLAMLVPAFWKRNS